MTDNQEHIVEELHPGAQASIENTGTEALSIAIITDTDARLEMDLGARQSIRFDTGSGEARIALLRGDPNSLLIVKPETP